MLARIRSVFAIKNYSMFIVSMMMIGIAVSTTSPYLSLYCTKIIGMSAGAYGIFMAVVSLSGVTVNTILAKYSDSGLNRKMVIVCATTFSAIGYSSYLFIHNYFVLLITVAMLLGLGAPTMSQIFASAREAVNADNGKVDSTFANSLLRSLFSLGFLIGPLVGSILLLNLGYHGVFLGTSSLFLFIGALVLLLLKSSPQVMPTLNVKSINDTGSAGIGLRNKYILLPFLTMILLTMCNTTYNLNIPLFVVNELHGSESQAGMIISLSAGIEIPIMIGLGSLATRFGNKRLMMIGCVLAAIYHIELLVATELWQIIVGQLLQASFVSMVIAIALSYFQDLLPTLPGLATILYTNASTLGQLFGNLTGGIVSQVVGFRYVYVICLLLAISAFILLLKTKSPDGHSFNGHSPSAVEAG